MMYDYAIRINPNYVSAYKHKGTRFILFFSNRTISIKKI